MMGLSDRQYMGYGERDPRRVYAADGKTLWQEGQDSARMLGCALFALGCTVIGVLIAAAVILLGE